MKNRIKKIILCLLLAIVPVTSAVSYTADNDDDSWRLLSDKTEATVYNPVKGQCNSDPQHTASGLKVNMNNIPGQRILAMERTMMQRLNLCYGTIVRIEGAGLYDGLWKIEDTMNVRFAGRDKIDFMVPKTIRTGKFKDVKVYAAANRQTYRRCLTEISNN